MRNFLRNFIVGMDLAIDIQLSHPSGDQLRVLRTKIENKNSIVHGCKSRNLNHILPAPENNKGSLKINILETNLLL